jgi:hypothetical protein
VQVDGVDGKQWTPAPIEHGAISEDAEGAETSLKVIPWPECPLEDMFPRAEGLPLHVRIWRALWDWDTLAETGTRIRLFDGEVRKPESSDWEIKASCQSGVDLFARPVPTKPMSRTCRAVFCDATCGMSRAEFTISAEVSRTSNAALYYIEVQAATSLPSSEWLSHGLIVSADYHTATPSKYWEWRPIQGVSDLGSGHYRIQIRTPFRHLKTGDTCHLYRGCAMTTAACSSHITRTGAAAASNKVNLDGEPLAPLKNPQTQISVTVNASKK